MGKQDFIMDLPIVAEWDKTNDCYTYSTAVGLLRLTENKRTEELPDRLIIGNTVYVKEEKK